MGSKKINGVGLEGRLSVKVDEKCKSGWGGIRGEGAKRLLKVWGVVKIKGMRWKEKRG